MLPQVAVANGKVGVAWVNNDQNDLFGVKGNNSLMSRQFIKA